MREVRGRILIGFWSNYSNGRPTTTAFGIWRHIPVSPRPPPSPLTQAAAHELGPLGISVNGINPGLIGTDSARMYAGDDEAYRRYADDVIPQTPAGRVGTPEDIAAVAAFLCSTDADFIRGQTLLVDGGLLSSSIASREHE